MSTEVAGSGRRGQILDAAMALADRDGLDAVTMRSVAERVGVTPMALYPHIGGKQALLDGLLDRLLAEVPLPPADRDWRERLVALGHGLRQVGLRHPAMFHLLLTRPVTTPAVLRVVEAILAALRQAGIPDSDAPRLERLLGTFVIGFVASEVNGRFGTAALAPGGCREQRPPAESPAHQTPADHLHDAVDFDAEFAADLDSLVALVSAVAAAANRTTDLPLGGDD